MTTEQMDPSFASALPDALVAQVKAAPRRRLVWRWRLGIGVLAGTTVVAGGAALAAGLLSQPGAPVNTQLGSLVTATRTGTATINLSPAPSGANDLSLTLTCISAERSTSRTAPAPAVLRPTCSTRRRPTVRQVRSSP